MPALLRRVGRLAVVPMVLEARGLDTFGKVIRETTQHGRLLQDLNAAPQA